MDISNYVIRLLAADKTQLFQESVGGRSLEADIGYTDFKPETTYEVYLKARNDVGFGKEEMVTVTTKKYCEWYLILKIIQMLINKENLYATQHLCKSLEKKTTQKIPLY